MKYIKLFKNLGLNDVGLVGGKTASIGQMIKALDTTKIRIPSGFALTAEAYFYHLQENNLTQKIKNELDRLLSVDDLALLREVGKRIRGLIYNAVLPDEIQDEIRKGYKDLEKEYGKSLLVAVRSSATAEDLPHASFAGQQETYLGVYGADALLDACKKCMASLFTDRAIAYRIEQGFDHMQVGLSVAVQKLVNANDTASGVMFTLDTESGFKDVVQIESSYGFGESVVKGLVVPDEFILHKPTFEKGFHSIIEKALGKKETKIIFKEGQMQEVITPSLEAERFSLSNDHILELAGAGILIENYYSEKSGHWMPMDIEWAVDSDDGKLYILQARPETVHAQKKKQEIMSFTLKEKPPKSLVTGTSIGRSIASGKVVVASSIDELENFHEGDIIVTGMTDPDWVPVMKKAGGIITDRGGRMCHAAIVSRELGIPAVIGTLNATEALYVGLEVTLDCSRGMKGYVYNGILPFQVNRISVENIKTPPVDIMINLAEPSLAFEHSFLPVDGVGLARIEFIMSDIGIHPMAIVEQKKVSMDVLEKIQHRAAGYNSTKDFFVEKLSCGIAKIAAAFYPRSVIVRLSDFKSNEYRDLLGGKFFEPQEENPMLGFRGAFRYTHPLYAPAFALECQALKIVREIMGFKNVKIMVPFVRTVQEAKNVIKELARLGLIQGDDDLELFMMAEVPSNALLIKEFCTLFDGISIGSNDITQLTLGVDRDSALLGQEFDERDEAVKKILAQIVKGARESKTYVSICGQAPSDFPEIARFLMEDKISSLSLNPDAVLPFLVGTVGSNNQE